MGSEVASCIAPGGDDYEHRLSHIHSLAFYVITETANNVRQHSRGKGFISSQVTREDGLVRIALADNGRGILRSFQDAGFDWSADMDHTGAILKALEARVSSSMNEINKGVGLTLVLGLTRLMSAWLLIVSGNGVYTLNAKGEGNIRLLPDGGFYRGTLIGLTFAQSAVDDFPDLLHRAKVQAGLLRDNVVKINFTS